MVRKDDRKGKSHFREQRSGIFGRPIPGKDSWKARLAWIEKKHSGISIANETISKVSAGPVHLIFRLFAEVWVI
jgi:hypothetical protein